MRPAALAPLASRTAIALLATVAAAALLVRLLAARETRRLLGFGFDGIDATPAQALAIFTHNARHATTILAAALVVELAHHHIAAYPRALRVLRALCDFGVGWLVVSNAVVVGASLGAYGPRMLAAVLPHGPVELAAFSLCLSIYLRARTAPLAVGAGRPLALALALLAVAAALETFAGVPT